MAKTILLLEHDEDDRYITQTLFRELRADVNLEVATTEDEFFSRLEGNLPLPHLILLNYHSSPAGAPRLISMLKKDFRYAAIPVIVGCGAPGDEIVTESYIAGASGFIKKAANMREMHQSMQQLISYWFECVILPRTAKYSPPVF